LPMKPSDTFRCKKIHAISRPQPAETGTTEVIGPCSRQAPRETERPGKGGAIADTAFHCLNKFMSIASISS